MNTKVKVIAALLVTSALAACGTPKTMQWMDVTTITSVHLIMIHPVS